MAVKLTYNMRRNDILVSNINKVCREISLRKKLIDMKKVETIRRVAVSQYRGIAEYNKTLIQTHKDNRTISILMCM